MLFIDLDKFKKINDTLGHRAGDELLKEVALRLSACVRDADTVARLSGDEFVIVLEGWHDLAEVAAVADKICHGLNQVMLADDALKPSASIGISLYPTHGADADTLMRQADKAMYEVKSQGGGKHTFAPLKAAANSTTSQC